MSRSSLSIGGTISGLLVLMIAAAYLVEEPLRKKIESGIFSLLANRSRDVAIKKTSVSGDIESPQVSNWETVPSLVQNAFLDRCLPGFEKEVVAAQRRPEAQADFLKLNVAEASAQKKRGLYNPAFLFSKSYFS
ncbi:MAG TPA: hypothetical protein VGA01_16000 [Candidatus Binatia bacterium]